jgi:hypothetical protein
MRLIEDLIESVKRTRCLLFHDLVLYDRYSANDGHRVHLWRCHTKSCNKWYPIIVSP